MFGTIQGRQAGCLLACQLSKCRKTTLKSRFSIYIFLSELEEDYDNGDGTSRNGKAAKIIIVCFSRPHFLSSYSSSYPEMLNHLLAITLAIRQICSLSLSLSLAQMMQFKAKMCFFSDSSTTLTMVTSLITFQVLLGQPNVVGQLQPQQQLQNIIIKVESSKFENF